MKSKKIISIILAVILNASIFMCSEIVFASSNSKSSLGASQACVHHSLADFTGVPACVNESGDLHICENNFPDKNFREYVIGKTISHSNANYITESEALKVKDLAFSYGSNYFEKEPVKSIKGIEFFTQLAQLRCEGHKIEEIDLSNNKELTLLMIPNNKIKELDLSKNTKLKNLSCGKNELEKLEINHLKLNTVAFSDNHIAQVDDFLNTDIKTWGVNGEYENGKGYYTERQTINLKAIPTSDGKWLVDLSEKVDKENFGRIKMITDGAEYNAKTGIITLDKWYDSIVYDYSYKARAYSEDWLNGNMAVTVNLTEGSPTDLTDKDTDNTIDSNVSGNKDESKASVTENIGKDDSAKSPDTGNIEDLIYVIPVILVFVGTTTLMFVAYSKKKTTE